MSYIEKEKLIKADIASIENRVRHAFNQGYDLGYKEGKERAKAQEPTTKNDFGVDAVSRTSALDSINWAYNLSDAYQKINDLPSVTPQEPKWIPVSERLPDTDDEVLCWHEYYHWSQKKVLPEYGIGCYLRETSAWFGEVVNGKDARVIAWMPLPKAYKPESEDT